MTEFEIGDIVRIKTPRERKKFVQPDSAAGVWKNQICFITGIKEGVIKDENLYSLSFVEQKPYRSEKVSRLTIEEYWWSAEALDKRKSNKIEESAYEKLIGGVK